MGTRRLWVLVGLLALACAGLALALLLDDDESSERPVAAKTSPAEPGGRTVGFPVRVGDAPSAVAVGPENVWVLSEGDGTVSRVDPTRNEIVGPSVDVGGRPREKGFAGGALLVTRVVGAPRTPGHPLANRIQTRIRVGRSPWGLATAPGSVWVVNHDDDTVQQISTVDNSFVGPPIKVGQAPVNASFGYSALWVANSQSDTVSRVDLRARAVVDTIPVGDHPEGITVGADGIWVANLEDDTVSRIDPAKSRVVARIPVGDRPLYLKANGGSVWVPNSGDGTLSVIDSETNRVVGAPLPIGRSIERVGAGPSGVWAINASEDAITRVEAAPR